MRHGNNFCNMIKKIASVDTKTSQTLLHLSLIEDIGPGVAQRLLAHFGGSAFADLYAASAADVSAIKGISAQTAQKIVNGLATRALLDQELALLEREGVSWVSIIESHYPPLLKTIHLPPTVIYWKGQLPQQKSLAVVGSRQATSYGKRAIEQLVPPLVKNGWSIISGGALGIDTIAHKTALALGGPTTAVLGSGILRPYPSENQKLFEEICAQGGAIISPFSLRTAPLPGNFPARNRLIAGLSQGSLVIQAARRSGALITADYSMREGRSVFAVPGAFDEHLSAGCHALIAQGALITTHSQDILNEFAQKYGGSDATETLCSEEELQIPLIQPLLNEKDPLEKVILTACRHPSSIDELLEKTEISLTELTPLLFDLQLKGRIAQNMAGLWEAT